MSKLSLLEQTKKRLQNVVLANAEEVEKNGHCNLFSRLEQEYFEELFKTLNSLEKDRTLIISIYDMGYIVSLASIKNNEIVFETDKRNEFLQALNKLDLLNNANDWDFRKICHDNSKLSQYNQIIICEDGTIELKRRGIDY